jgi:hypothetical protein
MTLPELLIAVTIVGLLVTVLSSALIVTMGQHDNTEGRLNVARAEQSVSLWIPADLSSADTVDTAPQVTPCGLSVCDGIDLSDASNVLTLSWSTEVAGGTVETNVSYMFAPAEDGLSFELTRVECVSNAGGWSCESMVVLKDLPGPPGGAPFSPGVQGGDACTRDVDPVPCTRPTWVIIVSEPLAADATDGTQLATESERKDANRVIVSINGGGDADGAGGGVNQISITAGGTARSTIDAKSTQGTPSFIEAISRCGGPVTLIVDGSGSISSAGASGDVVASVRAFIETLAGTPVKIQVVEFASKSRVLGGSDTDPLLWHRYFDMTDPSSVTTLLGLVNGLNFNGYTNWEDALFRTFYKKDASLASIVPETVVFFTDGVPNRDRLNASYRAGGTGAVVPAEPAPQPSPPWPSQGSGFSQTAYNRAEFIAKDFRVAPSIDLIGVGVGGIDDRSMWISDPGAGYVWVWERGYRRYQQGVGIYESNLDIEVGTSFTSRVDYEKNTRSASRPRWRDTTPEEYYANLGDSMYRINGTRSSYSVTEAIYDAHQAEIPNDFWVSGWTNTTYTDYYANQPLRPDKYRINNTTSWYAVPQSLYDTYNQNSGESDGWRTASTGTWVSKATYDANDTGDNSAADGWIDTGSDQWVTSNSQALDWKVVPRPSGASASNPPGGYRVTKEYPATPPPGGYDGTGAAVQEWRDNAVILANLIAGNDTGVPAYPTGGPYVNTEEANMYVLPAWDQLVDAMKAVALGECGGTLTLQTKVGGTTPAPDSFIYQRTAVLDAADQPLDVQQTTVTTNQQFTSGTFDMTIPDGQYVTVEIRPQNYDQLTSYSPAGWSCKAGVTNRPFDTFSLGVPGGWEGIRVQVAANEAVSCTMAVS